MSGMISIKATFMFEVDNVRGRDDIINALAEISLNGVLKGTVNEAFDALGIDAANTYDIIVHRKEVTAETIDDDDYEDEDDDEEEDEDA
jgi:hypothetical protein